MEFPRKSFKNTKEELEKIPSASGLYYFYDKDDILLYIGKAKKLKFRIRDHKKCNDKAREGKFYSKMRKMNISLEAREKLEEEIRDFEFRCMGTIHPVTIDFVFHRTSRIEIEEMPHELTAQREEEMICKLKPSFNSETTRCSLKIVMPDKYTSSL